MPLITVQDLNVGYGNRSILKGLSFTVERADYLCIVGENGSGKTTLMRTLLGLQEPIGGRILFDEGLGKNGFGYLPQQNGSQKDFPASVREIVLSGCLGNRKSFFYSREDKERAARNMEKMHILDLEERSFRELSGGQQQRVLLARALTAAQNALLLDEPVSGLDPAAAAEMYELVANLNREGVTVIMISHDLVSAVRYADHILQIAEPVFFGTKEEFVKHSYGGLLTAPAERGKETC